jgi:UDP-4-amino-4,6-dideoxy-N-acetyl-beta-L-altrosamine transaminase
MIPYGKQDINSDDIEAVINVLQSNFLTQGPKVPAFEQCVAEYAGAKHGCAVNSATSALHIACLALDLGKGDVLWTSPNTFVASANCALYCGAQVDFVDIDPKTYNLCPHKLELRLAQAKKLGKLPKVVVAVHLCGQSCDMKQIHKLSKIYGFKIIEDASHAIGGSYLDFKIGSCRYSDITIFSFHPVKIVTTAEGGIALTNKKHLQEKMMLFRTHGITRDEQAMQGVSDGPWYYEQVELGYNYRMTELQAALGLSQMSRLEEFVTTRNTLATIYNDKLKKLPIILPFQSENTYSSFHLYVIRLDLDIIKKSHNQVFQELRDKGIGVNLHYIPVHIHPYYRSMGFKLGDFPEAEKYYSEAISIPIFHGLKEDQQNTVIRAITEAIA